MENNLKKHEEKTDDKLYKKFNDYIFTKVLGKGTFGIVYLG